jgi:hypothetical protein
MPPDYRIRPIATSDFGQWKVLFQAYIDFYKSTLPEGQYRNTFQRLVDPAKDLYGLVLIDPEDGSKILGITHYFPHQNPWTEKPVVLLYGTWYSTRKVPARTDKCFRFVCRSYTSW